MADPSSPQAVLLAWKPEFAQVLGTIAANLPPGTALYALAPAGDAAAARYALGPEARVLDMATDTPWIRDFGPLWLSDGDGGTVLGDALHDSSRPLDDAVPASLAKTWSAARVEMATATGGGAVVSDGTGACVVTRGAARPGVGCTRFIEIPPLPGDRTGHADLLVLIADGAPALVGRAEEGTDAGMALDTAAAALAASREVRRVAVGLAASGAVRSHLNALVLRDRVLVPLYPADGAALEASGRQALADFEAALPGRRAVGIDSTALAGLGGGIRCISLAVP